MSHDHGREPIDIFLSALPTFRQNGRDRWMAPCPAHDDRDPSLSIRRMHDGRILLKCFAGCGAVDIVESLGLKLADLFPGGDHYTPAVKPQMSYDEWLVFVGENSTRRLTEADKKKVMEAKLRDLRKKNSGNG